MKTNQETVASPGQGGKLGNICDMPTMTDLANLFHLCQAEGEIGIVTGEPGVGKTTAAQRYAADNHGAYMMTMSPATSALVPCLARLGQAVGAYTPNSAAGAWSDAIRSHLRFDPDPQVLLIDEAHHMSDASVEEVRAIFDVTHVGVVFIGSREIRERWAGRRWAQLNSRVFQRIDLDGPLADDIAAICKSAGVEGKRPLEIMRRAAAMPGGLRVVCKVLSVAAKLAGPGNPLKVEHVEVAFRDREAVT